MPPDDTTTSTAETLARFLEQHAQRRPDGIAIRYGDLQWSWAAWASPIRRTRERFAHLAAYKCPRTVDFTTELPRNASGKILKTQLREPYWKDRTRKV